MSQPKTLVDRAAVDAITERPGCVPVDIWYNDGVNFSAEWVDLGDIQINEWLFGATVERAKATGAAERAAV